jgi:hypothetical protein
MIGHVGSLISRCTHSGSPVRLNCEWMMACGGLSYRQVTLTGNWGLPEMVKATQSTDRYPVHRVGRRRVRGLWFRIQEYLIEHQEPLNANAPAELPSCKHFF